MNFKYFYDEKPKKLYKSGNLKTFVNFSISGIGCNKNIISVLGQSDEKLSIPDKGFVLITLWITEVCGELYSLEIIIDFEIKECYIYLDETNIQNDTVFNHLDHIFIFKNNFNDIDVKFFINEMDYIKIHIPENEKEN